MARDCAVIRRTVVRVMPNEAVLLPDLADAAGEITTREQLQSALWCVGCHLARAKS